MLTPKEQDEIEKIIENMTDEEVEAAIQRLLKMVDMQNRVAESFQTNPMTFSACETIQ